MYRRIVFVLLSLVLVALSSFGQKAKEVVLQKAGTLSSLISEEEFGTITDLKVSGPINGGDLRLIRHMAGATDLSNTSGKVGVLRNLDLKDAKVVKNKKEFYCIEDLSKTGFEYSAYEKQTFNGPIYRQPVEKSAIIRFDKEIKADDWNLLVKSSKLSDGVRCETFEKKNGIYMIKFHTEVNVIGTMTFYDCKSLETVILPENTQYLEKEAVKKSPNLWLIESSNPAVFRGQISDRQGDIDIDGNAAYFKTSKSAATINVQKPGTLIRELRRYLRNDLSMLKVTGNIDGNDIYALREYCGKDIGANRPIEYFIRNNYLKRSPKTLDLSEASIVETDHSAVYWGKVVKKLTMYELALINDCYSVAGGFSRKIEEMKETAMYFYTKNDIVGPFMFEDCYFLERIVLPRNTKMVYDYAFQHCYSLKEVVLPEGFDKKNLSDSICKDFRKDELAGNIIRFEPTIQTESIAHQAKPTTLAGVNSQQAKKTEQQKDNASYEIVEKMPEFSGNINWWLASNLRYPPEAAKKGIEGRVVTQFVVKADGEISDPVVVRGVDPSLDQEALRVVNAMPKWIPGKINGKNADCKFTLPIVFRLN